MHLMWILFIMFRIFPSNCFQILKTTLFSIVGCVIQKRCPIIPPSKNPSLVYFWQTFFFSFFEHVIDLPIQQQHPQHQQPSLSMDVLYIKIYVYMFVIHTRICIYVSDIQNQLVYKWGYFFPLHSSFILLNCAYSIRIMMPVAVYLSTRLGSIYLIRIFQLFFRSGWWLWHYRRRRCWPWCCYWRWWRC